jgi:hypothetical protein
MPPPATSWAFDVTARPDAAAPRIWADIGRMRKQKDPAPSNRRAFSKDRTAKPQLGITCARSDAYLTALILRFNSADIFG